MLHFKQKSNTITTDTTIVKKKIVVGYFLNSQTLINY